MDELERDIAQVPEESRKEEARLHVKKRPNTGVFSLDAEGIYVFYIHKSVYHLLGCHKTKNCNFVLLRR